MMTSQPAAWLVLVVCIVMRCTLIHACVWPTFNVCDRTSHETCLDRLWMKFVLNISHESKMK